MPTYEYECEACGKEFELFQSMRDEPIKDCPDCGGIGTVRRLIGSGGGLIFKGSGFYITDYKNKGNGSAASPSSSSGKSEKKSETAPCGAPAAEGCPCKPAAESKS